MTDNRAYFRFYQELNDFLPHTKRQKQFAYTFFLNPSVKDAIEAIGVPHTEVDLILVNGNSVDFLYRIKDGDIISVYPVFESFDIRNVTRLRPHPLRKPKFVLDVHLGRLSRYMRLLGFDSMYSNSYSDDELVRISREDSRIILTRDLGVLKVKSVTHGYWIRSQIPEKQVKEVLHRFDLYSLAEPFSRCLICNGIIKPVDTNKILTELPPDTRQSHNNFSRCTTCDKIYWKGSHHPRLEEVIRSFGCQP